MSYVDGVAQSTVRTYTIISSSANTVYPASDGFYYSDTDIFITSSAGNHTFVPAGNNGFNYVKISIIGWNDTSGTGLANVTLLSPQ